MSISETLRNCCQNHLKINPALFTMFTKHHNSISAINSYFQHRFSGILEIPTFQYLIGEEKRGFPGLKTKTFLVILNIQLDRTLLPSPLNVSMY